MRFKKIAYIALAAVLALSLAACGQAGREPAPEPAPAPITGVPGEEGESVTDALPVEPDGASDPVAEPDPGDGDGLDPYLDDAPGVVSDAPDGPLADPGTISGTWKAEIDVEGYGTVAFDLYADVAPVTVANFVNLADSGFYDGLTFHRVIAGFMAQGGDPLGNGTGGSGTEIYGEFASNGWDNDLHHVRGALSMARGSGPDSASSQFFIVHEDSVFLDGEYAAFGMATSGMEVIDAICEDAEPLDDNGSIARDAQPVIAAVKIYPPEAA